MKKLFGPCAGFRKRISLLACDALADADRREVERHWARCANCRQYHAELRNLTHHLVMLGAPTSCRRDLAKLEPSPTARARWAVDFPAAVQTESKHARSISRALFDWCHDVLWPCRRAWLGLAAVWLIILALNLSIREPSPSSAAKASRPSPEMVRAFLESQGQLVRPAKSGS